MLFIYKITVVFKIRSLYRLLQKHKIRIQIYFQGTGIDDFLISLFTIIRIFHTYHLFPNNLSPSPDLGFPSSRVRKRQILTTTDHRPKRKKKTELSKKRNKEWSFMLVRVHHLKKSTLCLLSRRVAQNTKECNFFLLSQLVNFRICTWETDKLNLSTSENMKFEKFGKFPKNLWY